MHCRNGGRVSSFYGNKRNSSIRDTFPIKKRQASHHFCQFKTDTFLHTLWYRDPVDKKMGLRGSCLPSITERGGCRICFPTQNLGSVSLCLELDNQRSLGDRCFHGEVGKRGKRWRTHDGRYQLVTVLFSRAMGSHGNCGKSPALKGSHTNA